MSRMLCALIVAALMLPASGCPVNSPIVLGTWLFYFETDDNSVAAIILLEGGETARPDPLPAQATTEFEFGFVYTWAVEDSTFTLSQYPEMDQNPVPEVVATGTVATRRLITDGTLNESSVTWTARPL